MPTVNLRVNGRAQTVDVDDPAMPLLYALRDSLELHGPKFGCGLGQCGACTVIVNGEAVRSCQMPVSAAQGREITTLEGLGSPEQPHPVQAAFIAEQAAQCGYCTNGMIMTTTAFLAKTPKPSEAQVRTALANNLCRCGSHVRVLSAVMRASGQVQGDRT
jgi:nicotinate dehydrogenase subunit A